MVATFARKDAAGKVKGFRGFLGPNGGRENDLFRSLLTLTGVQGDSYLWPFQSIERVDKATGKEAAHKDLH